MAHSIDSLKYSSMRHYLHGIATTQQELGHPNPLTQNPLIWRMFKAIKRLQGHHAVRKRLPITVSVLQKIDPLVDTKVTQQLCLRAAMWLGTCGLLRSGEFAAKNSSVPTLKRSQLTFHDSKRNVLVPILQCKEFPTYMVLRLEQSKTDPFRQGTDVVVSNPTAIRYMLDYLHARGPCLPRQALLVGSDGNALSVGELVKFIQSLITKANIPNSHLFLGHSFRKGGATTLHEIGYPDSLIKQMGRWSSFAFATYIDTPLAKLVEAGRAMGTTDTLSIQPNSSFWDVYSLQ